MSLRFAALGCRLVLWDVNESGNQETAELVQKATPGAEVKAYTVDLSDREQIYRAADQVDLNHYNAVFAIDFASKIFNQPTSPIII